MNRTCSLGLALLTATLTAAPNVQARPATAAEATALPAGTTVKLGARGVPSYLSGELSAPMARGVSAADHGWAFAERHIGLFGLSDARAQLKLVEVTTDIAGGHHVIFSQLQDGVPVYRTLLAVHMDPSGVVRTINARLLPRLTSQARFVLPEAQARAIMTQELGPLLLKAAPGELFVRDLSQGKDVIAYRLPVFLADDTRGQTPVSMWIDAETGMPLWGEDPIMRDNVQASGVDVFGETVEINAFEGRNFRLNVSPILRMYVQGAERGAFNLVDQTTRDLGWIYTWDSNETFMLDNEYVSSNDNTFDNPVDPGHPAGVSAHYNARRTIDFYDEVYGRSGLDDAGLSVASLVQISDPVDSYPLEINAGWAGYGFNFMIYGAGGEWPPESGVIWSSFSGALDVIGHELNHGVGEFTVNLGYEHESGALNEHLADVFGLYTQAYYEGLDWLMGEGLFADPQYPYDAVRSFSDPTLYNQPDRMSTFAAYPLSYDAGGVHFNSGIPNKAFYLAVNGGRFNGVVVPPINADVMESLRIAGTIWYDILENRRVDPNSQLIDMRQATLDAARAVAPGALSSLNAAWDAVEVTPAAYPDPAVDVSEPNDYKGVAVDLTVGAAATGYIWNRADCDMYALTGDGEVDIILSGLSMNARMAVYKSGLFGIMAEEGSSDNEDTIDEVLHVKLKSGDVYYIEVMVSGAAQGDSTTPYTIKVLPG